MDDKLACVVGPLTAVAIDPVNPARPEKIERMLLLVAAGVPVVLDAGVVPVEYPPVQLSGPEARP